MELKNQILPICRANELEIQQPDQIWLIEQIWTEGAVGIIGGAPKCCKSWFGLDMAVSVASGTDCLGRFAVNQTGPVLVFLAEDAGPAVRARIQALCTQRNLDIDHLNLYVITASTLRLDLGADQQRLDATLEHLSPRLLLLDPMVRLHRLDENNAADISKLLGFVREMQRSHHTAIALVHHAGKKHRAQPGQGLRGSSDLHAFGDSNAYLARRDKRIILSVEHRSAKSMDPLQLELVSRSDDRAAHLQIVAGTDPDPAVPLADRVLMLLQDATGPLTRTAIREHLRVNNQRLGHTLDDLKIHALALKTSSGWIAPAPQRPKQLSIDAVAVSD
ncbi:MAG: AAA family ATPase [Chloroflexi bacterium]|nr:AAA family ATPase [Chloroflexota bacterium]